MNAMRVACISAHGCPLAAPGAGSAGGMSVFLRSVAQALALAGVKADVYAASHGLCPAPSGAAPLNLTHVAPEDAPGFDSIGYREVLAHLCGESSLEQAIDGVAQATRRFARRQRAWFRRDDPAICWAADVPLAMLE